MLSEFYRQEECTTLGAYISQRTKKKIGFQYHRNLITRMQSPQEAQIICFCTDIRSFSVLYCILEPPWGIVLNIRDAGIGGERVESKKSMNNIVNMSRKYDHDCRMMLATSCQMCASPLLARKFNRLHFPHPEFNLWPPHKILSWLPYFFSSFYFIIFSSCLFLSSI